MPRKGKTEKFPALYLELADWFHLLTAPEDYKEETDFYSSVFTRVSHIPVRTLLEMGSGGGNSASHMKTRFKLTLSDLSEDMLAISRRLNPECEHIQGDMRNLRLGRQFDAIFVHDAVSYLTAEKDLKAMLETAFIHCKPGSAVLFCPDYIKETLKENTEHGGHSKGSRGLRYLSWTWDPDPLDTEYYVEMAYIMKEGSDVSVFHDRHHMGVFSKQTWFKLMGDSGFDEVQAVDYPDELNPTGTPVFTGRKPL